MFCVFNRGKTEVKRYTQSTLFLTDVVAAQVRRSERSDFDVVGAGQKCSFWTLDS